MNKENFTVLVRGFYVNLSNRPQTVISEAATEGNIPASAMKVETGEGEDEANAASAIKRSYEAWKKSDVSPDPGDGRIPLPSCVALCANGKPEALYWAGQDIDSARKRLAKKDASPEILHVLKEGIAIDPSERALVVKNKIALVQAARRASGGKL